MKTIVNGLITIDLMKIEWPNHNCEYKDFRLLTEILIEFNWLKFRF